MHNYSQSKIQVAMVSGSGDSGQGIPAAELNQMTLKLQGEEIFTDGDRDKVRGLLRTDSVLVEIFFPKKYVDINAEYN